MTLTPGASCLNYVKDLIEFDTTSAYTNLPLIDYVARHLSREGVKAEILPRDDHPQKANLLATIGPADRPGVIVSGHTDTVPADPLEWQGHPFRPRIDQGRLYGRGSTDMKGFLGAVMACVPRFCAAPLRYPLHIAFSYDEEVGCSGVGGLITHICQSKPRPVACLVGEPTGMCPVLGHKGSTAFEVKVEGESGHSSASIGMNTIEVAAMIIGMIGDVREDIERRSFEDSRFTPAGTTIQIGEIQGGKALNIRPAQCCFSFEIRLLPGEDPAWMIAALEERVARANFGQEFTVTMTRIRSFPALMSPQTDPAWEIIRPLVGDQKPGYVSFGTEAGLFQAAGISSLVIGPGDIAQAHRREEYISLDQLAACENFLSGLCDRLCREDCLDSSLARREIRP